MAISDKKAKNLLAECCYLLRALRKIEEDGAERGEPGFGEVVFSVKDNRVAYRTYSVREHPKDT